MLLHAWVMADAGGLEALIRGMLGWQGSAGGYGSHPRPAGGLCTTACAALSLLQAPPDMVETTEGRQAHP